MPSDIKMLADFVAQSMTSPIWQDDGLFKLYCFCLSQASHNTYAWHGVQVQPGDMPLSERHVAKALTWSRNKLDRKLKLLEEAEKITLFVLPGQGTLLHVSDWPQNEAAENRWLQNGASSSAYLSEMEPLRLQNETISGQSCAGQWLHDETADPAACSITRPPRLQNRTTNGPGGSTTEPNPIRERSSSQSVYPSQQHEPEGFQQFWIAYPVNRRSQRSEAAALVRQAYQNGATAASLMDALDADKRSAAWHQEEGRFIPGIVKWLQKEAWRCFVEPTSPEEDKEQWTSR